MAEHLKSRVLLVDDEPVLQKLISGYLVAAGYVVQSAYDGLDAIRELRAGLPDLIISDLNMPRMAGLEFLGVVRKRFPHIPVLVMSDEAPDEMPEGVTADAYFQKNGYGYHHLPEAISVLTRKLPLRPSPPPVGNEPVQAIWDRDGHYIIGCHDCLREFSIPCILYIERTQNWTGCIHCGKMIQFLVATGQGENVGKVQQQATPRFP
jgi:CheY-like chemotaxis protein